MPGLKCARVEMPFEGAAHGASKGSTAAPRSHQRVGEHQLPEARIPSQSSKEQMQVCAVLYAAHLKNEFALSQRCVSLCAGYPVPTVVCCALQAKCFLRSYSGQSVKTLSALCVTNLDTGRMSEGVHVATVYWRDIPSDVVDRVVARGLVMSSVGNVRLSLQAHNYGARIFVFTTSILGTYW